MDLAKPLKTMVLVAALPSPDAAAERRIRDNVAGPDGKSHVFNV
jgi:hypothetical protein